IQNDTTRGLDSDETDPMVPVVEVDPAAPTPARVVDETPVRVTAYRDALEIRWADGTQFVGAGPVRFGQSPDGTLSAIALEWDDARREAFIKMTQQETDAS